MKIPSIAVAVLVALSTVIAAQTAVSDDQQIRALIAKYDSGQTQGMGTKDRIFWSGAIKRPVIGSEPGEEVPGDRALSARKPGTQRTNTTPVRIEIAKSGDLAYEFSNRELNFELKDGKKERGPTSVLRVWKKEVGQWKIAAMFARPHYQDQLASISQDTDAKLRSDLEALHATWFKAFDRGDGATMDQLEWDNLILVMPDGTQFRKTTARAGKQPTLDPKAERALSDVSVRRFADTAILTGVLSTKSVKLTSTNATTVVFARSAGQWKIASAQWSTFETAQ